jgi:hypothetical protein
MGINPYESSETNPAIQAKNIAWLKAQTALLKAQNDYVKEVNKSKKETWEAMTESVGAMQRFSDAGGFTQLFGGSIDRVKTQIGNQIEGAFAPITNEISKLINDLIEEGGLKDALQTVGNAIGDGIDALKSFSIGVTDAGEDINLWWAITQGASAGIMTWIGGIFAGLWTLINSIATLLGLGGGGGGGRDPGDYGGVNDTFFSGGDSFYDPYIEGRIGRLLW